jgi:hypothetical protein
MTFGLTFFLFRFCSSSSLFAFLRCSAALNFSPNSNCPGFPNELKGYQHVCVLGRGRDALLLLDDPRVQLLEVDDLRLRGLLVLRELRGLELGLGHGHVLLGDRRLLVLDRRLERLELGVKVRELRALLLELGRDGRVSRLDEPSGVVRGRVRESRTSC